MIILVIAFIGITNIQAQDSAHKEAFVGSWVTVVPDSVADDSVNRLLFHIERAEDGSYTGTVDSPDQDFFDIPFSKVVVSGDSLTLNIDTPYVQYSAQLTADASRIEGTWKTSNQSSRRFFEPLTDSIAATLPEKPMDPEDQRPKAEFADVNSPSAIVEAAYDVISGPADEERNWDRFRSLFLPNARLIPTARLGGQPQFRSQMVEQFIKNAEYFSEQDFYERGIDTKTERFGDMAQVFSTYESRRSPDAEPFARGINSFQLWYDANRWWIVNLMRHNENKDTPIPERYLDKNKLIKQDFHYEIPTYIPCPHINHNNFWDSSP